MWRLPICQASRASSRAPAAAISTSASHLPGNQDDRAVVEQEAVAVVQRGRRGEGLAGIACRARRSIPPPTMPLVGIEHHPVDDARSIKLIRAANR